MIPEVFKAEICAGLNPRQATKQLLRAKFLLPDDAGKSSQLRTVPGYGRQRLYHFSGIALADNVASA